MNPVDIETRARHVSVVVLGVLDADVGPEELDLGGAVRRQPVTNCKGFLSDEVTIGEPVPGEILVVEVGGVDGHGGTGRSQKDDKNEPDKHLEPKNAILNSEQKFGEKVWSKTIDFRKLQWVNFLKKEKSFKVKVNKSTYLKKKKRSELEVSIEKNELFIHLLQKCKLFLFV